MSQGLWALWVRGQLAEILYLVSHGKDQEYEVRFSAGLQTTLRDHQAKPPLQQIATIDHQ